MHGSLSIMMAAHEALGQAIAEASKERVEPSWAFVRVKLDAAIDGLRTAARLLSQGESLTRESIKRPSRNHA